MKIKEYINKIVNTGNKEDMEELSEMLDEAILKLKMNDEECYNEYKMKLYEMANGKILDENMAEEWVMSMKPRARWTMEETDQVLKQYNITSIDSIDWYVVMNMLYSDMKSVLGSGDDEESLTKYVNAAKDWLQDEDAGPDKLYNYWKYVAKG